MIRDWLRFIFFPPFVLLYIMNFGTFIVTGSVLAAAAAGLVWLLLMIHPRTSRPIIEVSDKMPWVR